MKIIPFVVGFVSGYCLIRFIVNKLLDNDSIDINTPVDCPVYIEKDGDNTHCHYNY